MPHAALFCIITVMDRLQNQKLLQAAHFVFWVLRFSGLKLLKLWLGLFNIFIIHLRIYILRKLSARCGYVLILKTKQTILSFLKPYIKILEAFDSKALG